MARALTGLWCWLLAAGLGWAAPAPQGGTTPAGALNGRIAIRVFIDCHGRCDGAYLRTELNFVDHVTERKAADVHVLITTRATGGGGTEYAVGYIGLGEFAAIQDSAIFTTVPGQTDDDVRSGLARTLKIGLLRYVARTPMRDSMDVVFKPLNGKAGPAPQTGVDPWNFWVFRVRGSLDSRGEESSSSFRLGGAASANRVTEAWKFAFNYNNSYRRDWYSFEDDEEDDYTSISREAFASASAVKTLGAHWGGGIRASYSTSTYTNQDRTLRLSPAIEYDVFPYSESTRRQLTFRYQVGLNDFTYRELTLYGKLEETLLNHALSVNLDMRQPWGTIDVQGQFSQYIPDLAKKRLTVEGYVSVRLFKGFSLNVGGEGSLIRDQIYLPAEGASNEEILLRQRQIATGYDYGLQVGFSYSFGSVYNNVVNTRLSGF